MRTRTRIRTRAKSLSHGCPWLQFVLETDTLTEVMKEMNGDPHRDHPRGISPGKPVFSAARTSRALEEPLLASTRRLSLVPVLQHGMCFDDPRKEPADNPYRHCKPECRCRCRRQNQDRATEAWRCSTANAK